MAKGSIYEHSNGITKQFWFFCPGCRCSHGITFAGTSGSIWEFNNDIEKPTISPSILCNQGMDSQCHSFVKEGKIQFLSDCNHKLAGQTVELPYYENFKVKG